MPPDDKAPPHDRVEHCYHCGEPITDADHVLLVATSDGHKLAMHAQCFTETTFDPDLFTVAGLE